MKGKKVLQIDFDGVIHNAYKGYLDGEIYGPPVKGAVFTLHNLAKNYKLFVFTARDESEFPRIKKWLIENKFPEMEITNKKIPALAYIDNRAVRFTNWSDIAYYFL